MRKLLFFLLGLGAIAGTGGWLLSAPRPLDPGALAGLSGDAARGERVFWAAGCAGCHAAPEAEGEDRLVLSGGYRMDSPFGTFIAPNISPSSAGIGGWSTLDLANALIAGISPEGAHYYPALPYTTYQRMRVQDAVDLKTFLDTLPASEVASLPHEVGFPFNIRRGLGLWKLAFLDDAWVMESAPEHGRYLVEALGHCAECHTPRNAVGVLDRGRWLKGAPNPSGKGKIPGIDGATLTWSAADIAYYLETGFTPDFDSAGGSMTDVIAHMSRLTPDDRAAIADYLKTVP